MGCALKQIYAEKKELQKNAKAGNPEVIWVLCLRYGLEAEENSTLCVS